MKQVNMEQVFDTLEQQRKNLNRCLGEKNNTYRQILLKRDKLSVAQNWNMISHMKTAQELLSAEEYEKLWSLPKLRALAKVIEHILYNLKYEPFFMLDDDCFYLKQNAFEHYALLEDGLATDFVLLPYGKDYQIYEFVISGVLLKSMWQSAPKDKVFAHTAETEFIVGYYKNICFVVRIVPDILNDKKTMLEISGRYDYGLSFSAFQPRHIKFIQAQMTKLRKKLMLWMECQKKILLPGKLGSISLVDMAEHYPNIGKYQWIRIFETLQVDNHAFSVSLWRKLATSDLFSGVFNGMKMMLQKFNGCADMEKDCDYFYFLDDTQKTAIRIFWRKGWMAEVFVEYLNDIEFPVLTNGFIYFVKTVKDLKQEPLLRGLFANDKFLYIWKSYK